MLRNIWSISNSISTWVRLVLSVVIVNLRDRNFVTTADFTNILKCFLFKLMKDTPRIFTSRLSKGFCGTIIALCDLQVMLPRPVISWSSKGIIFILQSSILGVQEGRPHIHVAVPHTYNSNQNRLYYVGLLGLGSSTLLMQTLA